jgi:hypothetical protein
MQDHIEQEFDKMIAEMKDLENKVRELSLHGIRVNEELAATVEILKNQIDTQSECRNILIFKTNDFH